MDKIINEISNLIPNKSETSQQYKYTKKSQNITEDSHVIFDNVLTVMEIGLNLQKKIGRN